MEMIDIYEFITKSEGIPIEKMQVNSDLNDELGIDGDDFSELMELFKKEFGVNMENYRWYFHHGEEGWSIGTLFVKPPYARVQRIAVTPRLLLQAATAREWPITYPEHHLPSRRYDILIDQIALLGLALLGLALLGLVWLIELVTKTV